MTSPLPIVVRNVHKAFGSNQVLNGIDLDIRPKESVGVIGGSGTGKSVLIKLILGLLPRDKGDISIFGTDMSKANFRQRQEILSKIGVLFQGGALFDSMSVWENIAFALMNQHKMPKAQAKEVAIQKLVAVNLEADVADRYPAELSGGMQKRVALARAIAADPKIIFFDEPTTGLDPIVSTTINHLIVKCVKDLGASAVTITHDIHSLRMTCDRVALLHQGKLIWSGSTGELDTTDNPYVDQFVHGKAEGPFTTPAR